MGCCGSGRVDRVFGNPAGFARANLPSQRPQPLRVSTAIKPERKQPVAPEGTMKERVERRRKDK